MSVAVLIPITDVSSAFTSWLTGAFDCPNMQKVPYFNASLLNKKHGDPLFLFHFCSLHIVNHTWAKFGKNLSVGSILEFQFQFLHRIVITKKRTVSFGIKQDSDCLFCGEDSIDHTFIKTNIFKKILDVIDINLKDVKKSMRSRLLSEL